jgi:chitodextrinase
MDLGAGDSASLRLFTAEGELAGPAPGIVIASAAEGRAQVWPRLLAQAVNAAVGPVRAGRPGEDGELVAVAGSNPLWVNEGSAIVRVEVQVLRQPVAKPESGPSVAVDSVPATVQADDQGAILTVLLRATAPARATLVARAQAVGEIGRATVTLEGGAQAVPLELPGAAPGDYTLVITAPGVGEAVHAFSVLPASGGEVAACNRSAPAGSADPWAAGTAYWAGDLVTFGGKPYRAKWWSLGEQPPGSDAWAPATSATTESAPAWRADRSYRGGDTVRYRGEYWRTKWWNRGSAPSLQTGWVRVPAEPCS